MLEPIQKPRAKYKQLHIFTCKPKLVKEKICMPTFQTVRGMRDLLGEEAQAFTYIIAKARETAALYGYREVITPVVEPLELLARSRVKKFASACSSSKTSATAKWHCAPNSPHQSHV